MRDLNVQIRRIKTFEILMISIFYQCITIHIKHTWLALLLLCVFSMHPFLHFYCLLDLQLLALKSMKWWQKPQKRLMKAFYLSSYVCHAYVLHVFLFCYHLILDFHFGSGFCNMIWKHSIWHITFGNEITTDKFKKYILD